MAIGPDPDDWPDGTPWWQERRMFLALVGAALVIFLVAGAIRWLA